MSIYREGLCVHVKSLLSGEIPEEDLHRWIGVNSNMNPSTFKEWSSEISSLIALQLQGRIDEINPAAFNHLSFVPNSKGYSVMAPDLSQTIPDYWPRDRVLSHLLQLDTSQAHNQKVLAGMMKLKTAIAPRDTREPSVKQKKEHFDSITMPFSGDPTVFNEIEQPIRTLTKRLIKHARLHAHEVDEHFLPLTMHPAKDKSFAVIYSDGARIKTSKRYTLEAFNTKCFLRTQEARDIYLADPDTFCSRLFLGFRAKNCSFELDDSVIPKGSTPLCVIFYIPQPGDKERVVAIPTAAMQSLSYPIGKVIKEVNSSWKIQGVDSHDKCCEDISRTIRELNGSQMFYSIDMSNFTDRLPYHGLTSVLVDEMVKESILRPVDKLIMETVCESAISINNTIARYGVGTPMGTFPSFPAASMSNGIVATIAYCKAHNVSYSRVKLDRIPAKIIGDDFVCWDDRMASEYKKLMERLGVTIQPSKCLQATYVAEMCSKIITDLGVFQQKKIDSLQSAASLSANVEQYRYYGEALTNYIDPGFVEAIQYLRDIPFPQGLGPELEDPYWDQRPFMKLVYTALKTGREFGDSHDAMNARDYETIRRRTEIFPKGLAFEVDSSVQRDIFQKNILIESMCKEIEYDTQLLLGKTLDSEELVSTAQRILELDKAVESLQPSGYVQKRRRHLDFHLDNTITRDPRKRRNYIDKSDKDTLEIVKHYQSQEKEMTYSGR